MSQVGFEPGIYDSLLLEFAVAHKPTQPPRPDNKDNFSGGLLSWAGLGAETSLTGGFCDLVY